MKTSTYFFLLINLFMGGFLLAQSCHDTSNDANAKFTSLAKQEEFRDAHPLPRALSSTANFKGEMIALPITEGDEGNAYLIKATSPTDKYLFVFQEWWGLNDHIKAESDRLYAALDGTVNVLAIDLYDGKVGTTRRAAGELMQAAKPDRCATLVKAAMSYAGKKAKIATIGWCFGGGWSLQATILAAKQSVGCVMYYGMPEKETEKLSQLNTDILAIYATQDKWINKEVANEFEANMKIAKKKVRTLFYEADHAFCNPSNPKYVEDAAQKANAEALAYLKKHLK